ncbi:hypothetical protein [Arenimonas oryziterrae]|uniref:Carboxypeptidase regulatory-like domain-containing protein n=1 Tax=Arenimonas oryziterrae DSM 21050 = YC6267 TaxID=1121015 RepID=A0A091ASK4_9GAMM|nr:hypothetical protein [Arenimonas oryziterrae]KFN42346.1 hypothetical protein N789_14245 [Arenimonas oryziterrae DSM 21050 = YC6267]
MAYVLSGRATLGSGAAVTRVAIFAWDTLDRVATVIPDSDGEWNVAVLRRGPYCALAVGPFGYQPVADGPIVAVEG